MAWTQKDLDALEEAIASGAQSVAYESKSVSYRSLQDMLYLRDMIRKELGLTSVNATMVAAHDRGF
jgi:hypothetical protein